MFGDAHSDLLLELVHRQRERDPFGRRWLPRLRAGDVGLQICAIFAADEPSPAAARASARRQADAFAQAVRDHRNDVVEVRAAVDLDPADNRVALILAIEGADALAAEDDAFEEAWERGVRVVGLTWNRANAFAGGVETPENGLTDAGAELVERLIAAGGVVDLAHASARTFDDVLSAVPPGRAFVSHAGCRAVYDHPRNLDDEQLRALAGHGGLFGVAAVGDILGEASRERWLVHVEHAASVAGIDHVCLGSDFIDQVARSGALSGGWRRAAARARRHPAVVPGLAGPQDYPRAAELLRRAGLGDARLFGENLRTFLAEALPRD